jgi:hypothetical protein
MTTNGIPRIRPKDSPLAKVYGATDHLGREVDESAPSPVNLMKAAAILGRVRAPIKRPSKAELAKLRKAVERATDPIAKAEASNAYSLAVLKAVFSAADTLPPGVAAHSQLDYDPADRVDSERRAIPRLDPREFAPSVDGINAHGLTVPVEQTSSFPGGIPYREQSAEGLTGNTHPANPTGSAVDNFVDRIEKAEADGRSIPPVRLPGSPLAKAFGATDASGKSLEPVAKIAKSAQPPAVLPREIAERLDPAEIMKAAATLNRAADMVDARKKSVSVEIPLKLRI